MTWGRKNGGNNRKGVQTASSTLVFFFFCCSEGLAHDFSCVHKYDIDICISVYEFVDFLLRENS